MILGPIAWLTILLFVAPLAAVLVGLLLRNAARRAPDWQADAERRGLARRSGGEEPRHAGTVRGREVELFLRPAGPGNPTPLGILSVAFDDGGLGLRLRRQGMLDRYGRDLDHEIGDEAFDRRFVVQAAEPARLLAWLNEERRAALLDAATFFTRVERGWLVAEVPRGPGGDEFEPRLAALVDLAEELELDPAPRTERATPHVEGPPEPAPTEPARIQVPSPAPAPPPESAEHVLAEELETPETSETSEPAEAALPVQTVALALFGDAAASFEVEERFQERFRDGHVDWTGVLVDRTSSTAELELLALDPSSLSPRVVRARLEVPPHVAAELDGREGTPVQVRARLAGCDPFLRTLTLSDVTLLR